MSRRVLIFLVLASLAQTLYSQRESSRPAPVELKVPDIEIVNQDGQHLRFDSGIIKNRKAVISSFFTTCTSFCPLTQQNLGRLARVLGNRMGHDVVFISVSVDPVNDTPAHMKEWSEKFHTGPGWTLASGNKSDIETLLKSLGLYVELAGRHQSAVIIGTLRTAGPAPAYGRNRRNCRKSLTAASPRAATTPSRNSSRILNPATLDFNLHRGASSGDNRQL